MGKAKIKSVFFCQSCGHESAKWIGKCPSCDAWNSFQEERVSKASVERANQGFVTLAEEKPIDLQDVTLTQIPRYKTEIQELDRVLGGGIVPGTLTLLGGDPGIGKSTLVLQLLNHLAKNDVSVLYVTGEESKEQIKLRANRLNVGSNLMLVAENDLDKIQKHIEALKPQLVVIDSIQTLYLPHLETAPGSVSQVRECTGKLLFFAKSSKTSVLLIGHVTKEGAIAGPRVLEHMVDTVLYFEGENSGQFRILRTIKNRYGSTNEIGVFEMTHIGLKEIQNPSEIFLGDRQQRKIGACVTATVEGSRSLLTEIQSLVTHSGLSNPRRTAIGVDHNRVSLILAVIEKVLGLKMYDHDVYVSATGGLKLYEPASDLSILFSIISSFRNQPINGNFLAVGEVALTGEIRPVAHIEKRISEAQKMGYEQILIPKSNKFKNSNNFIEILEIDHVEHCLDWLN